jgi:hypothetical protein
MYHSEYVLNFCVNLWMALDISDNARTLDTSESVAGLRK